ncbi:hypothetical protein B0H34DRAFT_716635 [Crassisporium funariophilum]|nr:hypothetical protein B0H34DRAFT_716635 [Crassisporium funariophilum]
MPRVTERQQQTNKLLDAFIVNYLAQLEADMWKSTGESGSDSDKEMYSPPSPGGVPRQPGEDSSESDSDTGDVISAAIISSLEQLHAERYQAEQRDIPKTQDNLRNLMDSY